MYESFLANNQDAVRLPVDAAVVAEYAGRLPEALLTLWQEAGWGSFCGGMVRIVDPRTYQPFTDRYFRKEYQHMAVPFAVTGFGDIFVWVSSRTLGDHIVFLNVRYGTYQILLSRPEVLFNVHFFGKPDYYALGRYAELRAATGTLPPDECLGYVPALVLGGSEDDANIRRVKTLPYIEAIAGAIGGFGLEDFSGRLPRIRTVDAPRVECKARPTDEAVDRAVTAIAALIACRDDGHPDAEVMQRIRLCTDDIAAYRRRYAADDADRGVEPDAGEPGELKWLGLVDTLIACGYAAELDWKCELDDFTTAVRELAARKTDYASLVQAMDAAGFDADDDITVWGGRLNELARPQVLGVLDIGSDSYVLFLTRAETLGTLRQTARAIGRSIFLLQEE